MSPCVRNNHFEGTNFNSVYYKIIEQLMLNPEYIIINRKGQKLHELTNVKIDIANPKKCYAYCRNLSLRYLAAELVFYLKGDNNNHFIKNYAKQWDKIADAKGNIQSCYGYYIWKDPLALNEHKNQFTLCKEHLLRNPFSKKAVMTINDYKVHGSELNDTPCTMYVYFSIRDREDENHKQLDMTVLMRSNDIWWGLPYDLPFWSFVQQYMQHELIKQGLHYNLSLGKYTHFANSLHAYEKDFNKLGDCLEKPYESPIKIPDLCGTDFENIWSLGSIYNSTSKTIAFRNQQSEEDCKKTDFLKFIVTQLKGETK